MSFLLIHGEFHCLEFQQQFQQLMLNRLVAVQVRIERILEELGLQHIANSQVSP
jgi:hypothetical protein